MILTNLCVYTTMGNFFAACVSPLLVTFVQDFHVSFTDSSHLPTYPVLTIGLSVSSNHSFPPLTLQYLETHAECVVEFVGNSYLAIYWEEIYYPNLYGSIHGYKLLVGLLHLIQRAPDS
jgi:hypothetical protein